MVDVFWIGAGIAVGLWLLGYYISDGLKNFRNPKASSSAHSYPMLIKEKELHLYLGLSKEAVSELLNKYPNAPKIELEETTYYPYKPFLNWLSTYEFDRE